VNGSIFIWGAKPFVLETYSVSPGEIYTDYSRSIWVACLMSVAVEAGKNITGFNISFGTTSSPGHQNDWKLSCVINGSELASRFTATVLFIRRELVEDKT